MDLSLFSGWVTFGSFLEANPVPHARAEVILRSHTPAPGTLAPLRKYIRKVFQGREPWRCCFKTLMRQSDFIGGIPQAQSIRLFPVEMKPTLSGGVFCLQLPDEHHGDVINYHGLH
jgi:hypothetical protein